MKKQYIFIKCDRYKLYLIGKTGEKQIYKAEVLIRVSCSLIIN